MKDRLSEVTQTEREEVKRTNVWSVVIEVTQAETSFQFKNNQNENKLWKLLPYNRKQVGYPVA